MNISASELQHNFDKYIALLKNEDVYISQDGRTVAKLTSAGLERETIAWTLFGAMPDTVTLEEARDMMCREI